MHRLPLLAALLSLLSGCVSEPAPGSVTVYWNFQAFDFQIAGDFSEFDSGCLVAGVQEVDLDIYDARNASVYFQSHFCEASNGVPGAVVNALPPGSYSFVATAYRGHDHFTATPVFETTGSFEVAGGLDTPAYATLDILVDGAGVALPQPLLVLYSKAGQVTCSGVGGVNYSVSDAVGPLQGGTVNCDPFNELTAASATLLGTSYRIDYLQLLDPTGTFSTNEVCLYPVYHNGFAAIIDLPATVAPGCR